MKKNFFIIGAGCFGSTLAHLIATKCNEKVTVVEKRDHIGGNCYSFLDPKTGICCHKYGSHIFHTSSKEVYNFISQFVELNHYRHFVMTRSNGDVYSMPINLRTINKFFKKNFRPHEAKIFLNNKISESHIDKPRNLEEQAVSLIGKDLYQAFIRGYTKKQWQRDPKDLPSFIIRRLPFRCDYNTDYFNDFYQGIPVGGYTKLFEGLLNHKNIEIKLNTDFKDIKDNISSEDIVIYTGPIDEYFNYCYGKLEWRTLDFQWEILNEQDYQGCACMNEADEDIPYTRTHEFKHFHPECTDIMESKNTIICREYSKEFKDGDTPYYPVNNNKNNEILEKYKEKASSLKNVFFGGRLGTYQYLDMDKSILQALNFFKQNMKGFM